jgi:hypothetical protein
MDYNLVSTLAAEERLTPLDEIGGFEWPVYLDDAVQSNIFQDKHFAMPWQRFVCSPTYYNLAVFPVGQEKYPAIEKFLNYMSNNENQIENYKVAGWYPITNQAYQDLALECPSLTAIRLASDQVAIVSVQVTELRDSFKTSFSETLDVSKAIGAFDGETQIGSASPFVNNLTSEEAMQELAGEGLLFGSASFYSNDYEYPVGDYALSCKSADGKTAMCSLLKPLEGGGYEVVFEFEPGSFETALSPVQSPTASTIQGSICYCYWKDGVRVCIRIPPNARCP